MSGGGSVETKRRVDTAGGGVTDPGYPFIPERLIPRMK